MWNSEEKVLLNLARPYLAADKTKCTFVLFYKRGQIGMFSLCPTEEV